MISADDAFAAVGERAVPKEPQCDEATFTERERTQLDYLDSMIEAGVCKSFQGGAFSFSIPAGVVEAPVVSALKRRYEGGGWSVVVVQMAADEGTAFQFALEPSAARPAPSKIEPPVKKAPKKIPPVNQARAAVETAAPGRRLLVRMPTRARPFQALEVIEKYRSMAGAPVTIEVVVDEDDKTMLCAEVLQRLAALDCIVTVGRHGSKIEACNGGRVSEWDVLMLTSDDMVPVVDGYAACVLEAMQEHWPHLDGAVHFNDGHQRSNLCTLPILGRRLYAQFGYVYDPAYKSLFCDREQTDLLQALDRLVYVDERLIEHRHHVWGRAEKDALYERNDALESEDKATYERRKATRRGHAQFHFDSPPLWLSILICSVPSRRKQLDRLLEDLWGQTLRLNRTGAFDLNDNLDARMVEILVDDREAITIGEKRQALLERAHGHFVAFIDDDDGVCHNYVERVVSALRSDPHADCTSLEGVITTAGGKPERFTHSIDHGGWFTKGGVHYRTPNHLNAVRRGLALEVGFVSKNFGEDHEYSKRLSALLKRETKTGEAPLYFYWWWPK